MYDHLKNKFTNFSHHPFRQYQEDVIEFIENSTKPICVVQAPTGFGKSLANVCSGAIFDSFTYLVSSKQLQSQLHHDFPELEMMKGRNNYTCNRIPRNTADECSHSKKDPCPWKRTDCPYEMQKRAVLMADYRLLNYHYFLFEANHVGKFSNQRIVICDEGDVLEGLLASFISLYIPGSLITRLGIDPPPYKTTQSLHALDGWKSWAEEVSQEARREVGFVNREIEDPQPDSDMKKLYKLKRRLDTAVFQLGVFIDNVDKTWLFEEKKGYKMWGKPSYIFKPTWITNDLSEQFFFRHGKRFVLTSATFPPHTVLGKLLGRHPGDFDYFSVPSSFPEENRPVYMGVKAPGGKSIPLVNLTSKTWDEEVWKIIPQITTIMAEHLGEKGIIHAVSYKLAKYIMDQIGIDRLITHDSKNREEVLEEFRRSKERLILVSPSLERGVDLPDDDCRFICWAKAPYLSLGDKLTKSRVYSGKVGNLWYKSLTAQNIVQGCGRGVRHKDDRCVTYILDEQIKKLMLEKRSLFPDYFIDAVRL